VGAAIADPNPRAPVLWSSADCRLALLRPVHEHDAPLVEAFVNGLSPQSRLRRFHTGVKSLPPSWLQWMLHPDPLRDVALLAIAVDGRQPVCVGEARFALGDGPPGEREFALVVADDWQGVGLGSELLRQLGHRAALQGVERLVGDVMRDNLPMIELARRHGYAVRTHRGDPRLLQVARSLGDAPRHGATRAVAHRPGAASAALPAH